MQQQLQLFVGERLYHIKAVQPRHLNVQKNKRRFFSADFLDGFAAVGSGADNIDIADYGSPESLVFEVTTTFGPQDALGNPIDRWSSVGSLVADQQYYGEGKYEGFGFSWREEGGEMRMTGVFPGSPAANAGIERGQTVITLNDRSYADIVANEGINTFFDNNDTVTFVVEDRFGLPVVDPMVITKAIVTITPVPQWRTIPLEGGAPPVGYMEFRTFVSTADPVFDEVFADFIAAGVKDVVIDLRYNGGGLVRTAELLGDYLGGHLHLC